MIELTCRGHPAITGTHHKTLEFTREADITARATCVVGVAGRWDDRALRSLRGRVRVRAGVRSTTGDRQLGRRPEFEFEFEFEAEVSPTPVTSSSLVFRRGPDLADRTFAYHATAGAADVDRALVAQLSASNAELNVRIEQISGPGPASGALFVVALPIGNYDDLSPRARRTIEQADVILAEDTRRFRTLAREAGICYEAVLSYRDANEATMTPRVLEMLHQGQRVALVSDAGAPVVSDPGLIIVREAAAEGIKVVPVPGPSAPLTALMAAGVPADGSMFAGFLPRRRDRRRSRLAELARHRSAIVVFEAPHRLQASLDDLADLLGGRELVIGRELTKIHEEFIRTTTSDAPTVLADVEPRGEYTLVIGPAPTTTIDDSSGDGGLEEPLARLIEHLRADADVPTKALAAALAKATGLSRRAAYDLVLGSGGGE